MKMTTITKEIKILDRTLERLKENMRIAADIRIGRPQRPRIARLLGDIADLKNLFYILEFIFEENEIDWKK